MTSLFTLDETSEFFMEALVSLLRDKTIDKISVKELCQKTGYNRSTFYYYFEDIYDLQKKFEDKLMAKIISEISFQKEMTDATFVQSLTKIYQTYGEMIVFLSKNYGFYEGYKEVLKPFVFAYLKVEQENEALDLTYDFAMGGVLSLLERYFRKETSLSMEELTYFIQEQLERLVVG